jgi:hypothetical protein
MLTKNAGGFLAMLLNTKTKNTMKKLFSLFIFFVLCSFAVPTRTVSTTTATIATADDNFVIVHTGAAATYTLGTVSAGFSCTVLNHGTGNITFSTNIRTTNTQTVTILTNYSSQMMPGTIGNSIQLLYDGAVWRSIN